MAIGFALHAVKNGVAYLWPAYLTHKALQYGHQEESRHWIIYWCVLAFCTTIEFQTDILLFWIPFYRLFKIFFALYLWHPQTQGAQIIYERFLSAYLNKHESEIDAAVEEAQQWLDQKSCLWRDKAYGVLQRGAILALEKAQEFASPSTSPRISAMRHASRLNHAAATHECKED